MQNLDVTCAELGRKLGEGASKEREKLLTDSLGVLQEQGLYAFFLFLKASTRDGSRQVEVSCMKFLEKLELLQCDQNDPFKGLESLATRLDDLLFARELLMQALVYARYHAKARATGADGR